MKIIVVESSDELAREILGIVRKQWGKVTLVAAHGGINGLELSRRESPDIAIIDLELLDIRGLETIKRFRLLSEAPVLVLAKEGDEDDIDRALEYGANGYLLKPFRPVELIARLKALIEEGDVSKRM